ncbi:hypothetical protein ACLMJK_002249 [Lecanora helva]
MSALVQYESSVDEATEKFFDQTEALFVSTNRICDFAEWLQFLAFDVIGQITYSKRHGFVDRGEDVDGMVGYLGQLFSYFGPIGQIPILDRFILKNPVLRFLDKHGIMSFTFPVVTFAKARMAERLAEMKLTRTNEVNKIEYTGRNRGDLLSMFLKAKEDRPDFFHDGRVLTMAVSMAFAGSETTAISLAAMFYFLLKNINCYTKLMKEIDDAVDNGAIANRESGLVSWTEAQHLPYLDAVIKEAFRLHPAPGLPFERVVPKGGVEICGEMVPGGTIVGCNPWVIHRRPEIFGEDTETFKPERWLEVDFERRKVMEGCLIQFGIGSRTCIGKNISLLEIYKAVPSFLRRFETAENNQKNAIDWVGLWAAIWLL